MNANTIYYNTGISSKHSFQVLGTEHASINSAGTISSNLSSTNIHVNGFYLNDLVTSSNNPWTNIFV